jgi:predicted DNA binding protein
MPGSPRARSSTRRRPARRRAPRPADAEYALYRAVTRTRPGTLVYEFTRAHPENEFEILNRMEVPGDLLLIEVRVTGPDPGRLAREGTQFSEVVSVEAFPTGPRECLHRVLQRLPPMHRIAREHRILARYPLRIRAGALEFETVARRPQMRALVRALERDVGPTRVLSVRPAFPSLDTLGLTPAQKIVFREAVSAGYFGVPRGISVTELAQRLGRSKSTISIALAQIQRRLADRVDQFDLRPVADFP